MWSLGVYFYLDWIFLTFYSTADNGLDILIKCWKVKHRLCVAVRWMCERNNIFYVPHNLAVVMLIQMKSSNSRSLFSPELRSSEYCKSLFVCCLDFWCYWHLWRRPLCLYWPCHQNEHSKMFFKNIQMQKIPSTRSCAQEISTELKFTFSPSAIKTTF